MGSMAYLTFMTGGGALTAFVLQILHKQPLSDLFQLPVKMIITGFFGVALYISL